MSSEHLRIRCPECQCDLVVDTKTGAILQHKPIKAPLAGGKSFESLMADLDSQKVRAETIFEQEKAAMADRDRVLEEKFKEALKRAEDEPDEPLRRPFEFD